MHSIAGATQTLTAEYSGWTNRETQVVNLWFTNDECYYEELRSIIKNFDIDEQAEEIEQYAHWIIDVNEASMTTDLLSTSLGRVDWHEIARANQEQPRNVLGMTVNYLYLAEVVQQSSEVISGPHREWLARRTPYLRHINIMLDHCIYLLELISDANVQSIVRLIIINK